MTSKATIRLQHTEPFTIDNDRWTFLHPGEVQLEFIGYGETPVTATIAEDLNLTVNTTKGKQKLLLLLNQNTLLKLCQNI